MTNAEKLERIKEIILEMTHDVEDVSELAENILDWSVETAEDIWKIKEILED